MEMRHVEKTRGTANPCLHRADRALASARTASRAPTAARLLWARAHVAGRLWLAFLVDVSDDDAVLHSCLRRHLLRRLQTHWSRPALLGATPDEPALGRPELFGAANLE